MAHPDLDCRWGIFCEYNEGEIVRRVVDEIDQLRDLHGCETAEQKTNHKRERQLGAHQKPPKVYAQVLYTKPTTGATVRIVPGLPFRDEWRGA